MTVMFVIFDQFVVDHYRVIIVKNKGLERLKSHCPSIATYHEIDI